MPCSVRAIFDGMYSRSDVALIYNDRAVLENHHVSAAFRLMRIDDYNILAEFTSADYKSVDRLISSGVNISSSL